jgi:hypothetical protein
VSKEQVIADAVNRIREADPASPEVALVLLCQELERLFDAGADSERRCCVCLLQCVQSAPHVDRWSWGPDGLHCHARCEDAFQARVRWYPNEVPGNIRSPGQILIDGVAHSVECWLVRNQGSTVGCTCKRH